MSVQVSIDFALMSCSKVMLVLRVRTGLNEQLWAPTYQYTSGPFIFIRMISRHYCEYEPDWKSAQIWMGDSFEGPN